MKLKVQSLGWSLNHFLSMPSQSVDTARVTECQKDERTLAQVSSSTWKGHQAVLLSVHHQRSPCIHQLCSRVTVTSALRKWTHTYCMQTHTHRGRKFTHKIKQRHMQTQSHVDGLNYTALCVFITQMWMQIKAPWISSSVPLWLYHNWFTCLLTGCRPAQEITGLENIRATADKNAFHVFGFGKARSCAELAVRIWKIKVGGRGGLSVSQRSEWLTFLFVSALCCGGFIWSGWETFGDICQLSCFHSRVIYTFFII